MYGSGGRWLPIPLFAPGVTAQLKMAGTTLSAQSAHELRQLLVYWEAFTAFFGNNCVGEQIASLTLEITCQLRAGPHGSALANLAEYNGGRLAFQWRNVGWRSEVKASENEVSAGSMTVEIYELGAPSSSPTSAPATPTRKLGTQTTLSVPAVTRVGRATFMNGRVTGVRGGVVEIQYQSRGAWHRWHTRRLSADGSFSDRVPTRGVWKASQTGRYVYRAVYRGDSSHASSASPARSNRVVRR